MKREDFVTLLERGPLFLDGATGTNLLAAGMPRGGCTEAWVLENPEALEHLQAAYANAGSRVVYAPTFGANRCSLERFGHGSEVDDINKRLLDLSRRAVGDRALVAGDVSPTGLILEEVGGDASEDEVYEIYEEQIHALYQGGADLIVIETMISLDETKIALSVARDQGDLPVICTLTVDENGRTLFGGSIFEAVEVLPGLGADAVGMNCSTGPEQMEELIRQMAGMTKPEEKVYLAAKPNAGLPRTDASGNIVYDMTPDSFAEWMHRLYKAGAGLLGGCCGTRPEHIRMMVEAISEMKG